MDAAGSAAETFTLTEALRARARDSPEKLAAIAADNGRGITYAQLDAGSSRLAQLLLEHGVGAGDRVPHLDRNDPAAALLLLAAAKVGAALVPLNWRLAEPELAALVVDCDAKLLFAGPDFIELARRLAGSRSGSGSGSGSASGRTVALEIGTGVSSPADGHAARDPRRDGDQDAVVLQLYTSGTTGIPKGVQTTNRNLAKLTSGLREYWTVDEASRCLVAMPLFHIGGMGWLIVGLVNGATNVLVPAIEPRGLLETMESQRITNAFVVPTVLQMLCDVPGSGQRDWAALRSIGYGASPITTTTLKRALQTFGCPFFQVYGMTETTGAIVQLDAADHDPGGPREHLLRSAGRAYPWMELQIVEPGTGRALERNRIGEVRVRGDSVTPGYFRNQAETATALASDGWLATGDGGYLDDDGYLFLTDRIKDMIVSGAENVYPIEVEEVIASHPAIAEVAVFGAPDERWGELVCAAVVTRDGEPPDAEQLIAFARTRLAGYKLPRRVHHVAQLPKTGSGKVSKRELRETFGSPI